MFGLGARTEILRHFVSNQGGYSVATLASSSGYAKRNVAEECEQLERAGVLAVTQIANRFYYSLARRKELVGFIGDLPAISPPWIALFRVTDALVSLEETAAAAPERVMAVEARKTFDLIEHDLDSLGIAGPAEPNRGASLWPAMRAWAHNVMTQWAKGQWPPEEKR
jgi:hypothetical protein